MIFIYSFFFNDTATTEIYTLSLHDALPISSAPCPAAGGSARPGRAPSQRLERAHAAGGEQVEDHDHDGHGRERGRQDRKSTRLNSSHANISYAVFCLKKKKKYYTTTTTTSL